MSSLFSARDPGPLCDSDRAARSSSCSETPPSVFVSLHCSESEDCSRAPPTVVVSVDHVSEPNAEAAEPRDSTFFKNSFFVRVNSFFKVVDYSDPVRSHMNLTRSPLRRLLPRYFVPSFLTASLNTMLQIVPFLFFARAAGVEALNAAFLLAPFLIVMAHTLPMCLVYGFQATIIRFLGSGNHIKASVSLSSFLTVSIIVSVFACSALALLARPVMLLLGFDEDGVRAFRLSYVACCAAVPVWCTFSAVILLLRTHQKTTLSALFVAAIDLLYLATLAAAALVSEPTLAKLFLAPLVTQLVLSGAVLLLLLGNFRPTRGYLKPWRSYRARFTVVEPMDAPSKLRNALLSMSGGLYGFILISSFCLVWLLYNRHALNVVSDGAAFLGSSDQAAVICGIGVLFVFSWAALVTILNQHLGSRELIFYHISAGLYRRAVAIINATLVVGLVVAVLLTALFTAVVPRVAVLAFGEGLVGYILKNPARYIPLATVPLVLPFLLATVFVADGRRGAAVGMPLISAVCMIGAFVLLPVLADVEHGKSVIIGYASGNLLSFVIALALYFPYTRSLLARSADPSLKTRSVGAGRALALA